MRRYVIALVAALCLPVLTPVDAGAEPRARTAVDRFEEAQAGATYARLDYVEDVGYEDTSERH